MTKEAAIYLAKTKWWEGMNAKDICTFQLFERLLCMSFDIFHAKLEECLNRPVYTHELGLNYEGIKKEFLGNKKSPTLQEIVSLIPEEKRIIFIKCMNS